MREDTRLLRRLIPWAFQEPLDPAVHLSGMATRAVPAPLAQLPNALTIGRLLLIPVFVALMVQAGDAHSWPAGIVFARRRRHRPDRRLPRAPLARRVALRQDRRPARRPADDRRRRDPARRLRAAAVGRARRDRRAATCCCSSAGACSRRAGSTSTSISLGKAATWLLYLGDRLPHRHARPHELAALALLDRPRRWRSSRRCSTCATPGKSCSDEGRRHGGRRGHAPSSADVEPAEADGADRRQAVHGAHPRAAEAARLRGRDRHGRVPAAGDPLVLRRRRDARHRRLVLGRGVAARHRRLRAPRRRTARRHVPRHLRRRALRRRPDEAHRVPPREAARR